MSHVTFTSCTTHFRHSHTSLIHLSPLYHTKSHNPKFSRSYATKSSRSFILDRIRQEFQKMGTLYLSTPQIHALKELHAPDASMEEFTTLCNAARMHARRGNVTQEQKDMVELHVLEAFQSSEANDVDIATLTDELQQKIDLPRIPLYALVRQAVRGYIRHSVTKDQRELIAQHVEQAGSQASVSDLCDQLAPKLPSTLRRDVLCALVQECCTKISRRRLSKEDRAWVKAYVDQSPHKNVLSICEELDERRAAGIARRTLYNFVHNCCASKSRRLSTMHQRRFVRKYVVRRLGEDHRLSAEQLMKELHSASDVSTLPKDKLLKLIHRYISDNNSPKVKEATKTTKAQRAIVKQYIDNLRRESSTVDDDQLRKLVAYDTLASQCGLPKSVLYRLVAFYVVSSPHKLTRDELAMVREHIQQSPHAHDLPQLCNELLERGLKAPRRVVYSAVHRYAKRLQEGSTLRGR